VPRLLPLGGGITRAGPTSPAMLNEAPRAGRSAGPGPMAADGPAGLVGSAGLIGAKAARLARAAAAGLAVLPGWMVPVAEGRPAAGAGAAAVRQGRPAAARRAVLGHRLDERLAAELREAVTGLGGRVIVRSSSPLEGDPRWSGAFSSVAEVGPDDVVAAVRSCWSSAFAVDPLGRLEAYGLPLEALELGVLLQPEIRPVAGGVARVTGTGDGVVGEVTIEGVLGHPGPLLSGWVEGASACIRLSVSSQGAGWLPSQRERWPFPQGEGLGFPPLREQASPGRPAQPGDDRLAELIGQAMVAAVAGLAGRAWRLLGDDVIEWAADDNGIWLLQSQRSGPAAHEATAEPRAAVGREAPAGHGMKVGRRAAAGAGPVARTGRRAAAEAARTPRPGSWAGGLPTARASMPVLTAAVLGNGEHVPGRPGAPGTAAGRLVACRPHERAPGDCGDAILLVDQPVPALAPLLFAARGVIARTGAAGSHLAEVARGLGVPMVLGCHPERVTGTPDVPDGAFLAAIDGSTGDVALLPAAGANLAVSPGPRASALSGLQHPASALPAQGSSGQRI
jgi:phosphohistidine swiveling domain-containing protein